jgi:hypothetical protein
MWNISGKQRFLIFFVAKIRHFAIRKQKVPSNMAIGNFGKKIHNKWPDL